MKAEHRRRLLWGALGALLLVALLLAFRPRAVAVDMVELQPSKMLVTVDEEGETRVRDIFELSAPVAGYALRIEAEVGDEVVAGETVLAEIEPVDPTFLDFRSEVQAKAAVRAAESGKQLAQAEVDQAQAELDFASAELDRALELIRDNTISKRDLDNAQRAFKTSKAALATAIAALQVRNFELERTQAQLLSPTSGKQRQEACECVPIVSPVSGQILRVLRESAGVVSAGEVLLEIGDPRELEIVVDLLSSDAVKASPGQGVIIESWGGEAPLEGRVRRVEPFGFTKISALGIEEQRVNVIVDLISPGADWERLGHGYQVDVRIVLWEGDDVLKLALTALFRDGDKWATFVAQDGRAVRRHVTVGQRNGLDAQITAGLTAGDLVLLHPGSRVDDDVRIVARD